MRSTVLIIDDNKLYAYAIKKALQNDYDVSSFILSGEDFSSAKQFVAEKSCDKVVAFINVNLCEDKRIERLGLQLARAIWSKLEIPLILASVEGYESLCKNSKHPVILYQTACTFLQQPIWIKKLKQEIDRLSQADVSESIRRYRYIEHIREVKNTLPAKDHVFPISSITALNIFLVDPSEKMIQIDRINDFSKDFNPSAIIDRIVNFEKACKRLKELDCCVALVEKLEPNLCFLKNYALRLQQNIKENRNFIVADSEEASESIDEIEELVERINSELTIKIKRLIKEVVANEENRNR